MPMLTMWGALALSLALPGFAAAQAAMPSADAYAWAGACKECHEAIHDSWSRTKHAKTIDRLNSDERKDTQCIGCHVSGPKEAVTVDDKIVNASVQCESCHGPGKAHIEAARAGNAASVKLTAKPAQPLCETCHNDKSPHYKGFYYNALVGLVHRK